LNATRTLNYYFNNIRNRKDNENEEDNYKDEYEDKDILQGQLFYMSLSEIEKADLEFYVILTLTGGGNNYISGFKEMLNVDLYQEAYDLVYDYYKRAENKKSKWYTLFFYDEMKEINEHTLGRIEPVLNESKINVNKFITGIINNLSAIKNYGNSYLASCNIINILNGEKKAGQNILWDDINNALVTTGKFTSEDINILKTSWDKMQISSFSPFMNLYDALSGLVNWTKSEEAGIRNELENVWLVNAQKQQGYENDYLSAVKAFVSGTGSINTLKENAEKAYGKNSLREINHLDNIHTALINDFSMYLTMDNNR
jgi:hypothetical protein